MVKARILVKALVLYTYMNIRNFHFILFFQALAHVQSWRGKKQISAGKLLVELWKKEESNMGVARDKTGKVTGNYCSANLSSSFLPPPPPPPPSGALRTHQEIMGGGGICD